MNPATTTSTIRTREDEPTRKLSDVLCGICRRQFSRYTCPSCNLSYCGLSCFRSESHSRCSETFYRKEIEMGVKAGTSGSEGDRNKIIELLRRLDDQSAADVDGLSDQENEEDELVHRFSTIDISSASADDLLRLLTKRERDKFFAALKEPSSSLARELLESVELEKTRQLPWWEGPNDGGESSLSLRGPYGMKPDLTAVPTHLVSQVPRGIPLLYNICVVLLAYAYVTRHLSISPLATTTSEAQDQHEARRIFSQSVPSLMDRKSRLHYMSLTDAVVSFWSRFDPGSIDKSAMLVLLEDVAKLVRPRRITVAIHSSEEQEKMAVLAADHPSATTIMAISDMCSLFSTYTGFSAIANRRNHIVMKLNFYAAHILSTPPSRLHALADEIGLFSESMAKEAY